MDRFNVEGDGEGQNPYASLEQDIERVFSEESPRMTGPTQAHQLARLYSIAEEKRAARRRWNWRFLAPLPRWAQIAAVALIVVLAMNGISVAAADSLPGSPLYPLKRFSEQGNVLLAPSAVERAHVWMDLASRRLDEAQSLLKTQERVDNATLDAIDESILRALTEIAGTRGAERVALLQAITQLATRQQMILDQLAGEAQDPGDRARLEQSARWLEGIGALAGSAPAGSEEISPANSPTPSETSSPMETRPANSTLSENRKRTDLAIEHLTEQAVETSTPTAAPENTEKPGETATSTDKPERPSVQAETETPQPAKPPSPTTNPTKGDDGGTPKPRETDDSPGGSGTNVPGPTRVATEEP